MPFVSISGLPSCELAIGKRERSRTGFVEYSEWETILNQLQDRVHNKIAKIRRGAKKQSEQFYYPALQDLRGIRDAWRNHTMHTRSE